MYNDIAWREKGNEELCIANSKTVAGRFAHGHWSFLGLGSEKKWYGTHTYKPNGERHHVAEDSMINFSESGHPCSVDPVLSNEDLCEAKEVDSCLFTSVVIQIQSKKFFARLFPSISSVSREQ